MTHWPRLSTCICRWLMVLLVIASMLTGEAVLPASAQPPSGSVDPTWLHLYVRNRRQAVALAAAGDLASSGRVSEYLAQIQWVFDQPSDSWLVDANGQLTSVRQSAQQLFDAQNDAIFEQYRRTLGPAAAEELARVTTAVDATELLALAQRFSATDAGMQAIERLLSLWLDEGGWWRASELGLSLIRDERRARLLSGSIVQRTWLACHLAGRDELAAKVAEQYAGTGWLDHLPGTNIKAVGGLTWIGPGGDFHRNAQTAVTPPLLAANWHQPLESPPAYPKATQVISLWQGMQREKDQPTAMGSFPVVSGDRVVYREFDSIVAINTHDGATEWRYRTKSGLAAMLIQSPDERAITRRADAQRWEPAVANSLLGSLATDGFRVYAIDDYESFLQASAGGLDPREMGNAARRTAARNAMVALDLRETDDDRRLVWSTAEGTLRNSWTGHAFLGPPLPYEGWLYVISEVDRELRLSAVDPRSGRPYWQQPIAEVERSVIEDRGRHLRACTPTIAQGLVLCPTNIGLLVAVDALTGRLRWAHQTLSLEHDDPRRGAAGIRFGTTATLVQRHHPAFAPLVHVQGERAIYLPSHHQKVHCLSITDGRVLWESLVNDAECVGTVTDTTVLVIGRGQCRGLSTTDGHELWNRSLLSPPSGFGLSRGSSYLLPLADGHVAEIQLERGDLLGYPFRTASEPLGHLVAARDAILSIGAAGVTSYPQTAALRRQLQAEQTDLTDAKLALAEIQLVEGDLTAAIRSLEALRTGAESNLVAGKVEELLRKSYVRALIDDPDGIDAWLTKLKPLCKSPRDRLEWLVSASDRAFAQGRSEELVPLLTDLALLPKEAGITAVPGDQELSVSTRAWLRLLPDRAEDDTQRAALQRELKGLATSDQDTFAAAAIAYAVDRSDWSSAARRAQASSARTRGDWHRAEILLLRDAAGNSVDAARATMELAQLYESAGWMSAAGRMLEVLSTRFGHMPVENAVTFGTMVKSWPPAGGARLSWQRRQPLRRPVDHVTISAQPGDELALGRRPLDVALSTAPDDRYDGFHRAVFTPLKADAAVDWLYQSRDFHAVYGVFDRASAQKIVEFELPLGVLPPNSNLPQPEGSGVAFGLPAELRMLSPLQGRETGRAWSATLPDWEGRSGQPVVGTITSRIALMQLKSELVAVDTADGVVLWRRRGLPTNAGLMGNVRNGLSADEDYVTLLDSGTQSPYRVFGATTGRLHRQGVGPTGLASPLCPVRGRLHVFLTADALPRLRVWDPATDEMLVDEALHTSTRRLIDAVNNTHVSWLAKGNRLCIYDLESRRMAVDLPLTEKDLERITSLRTFRQGGRYYVSLQSDQPTAKTEHFHTSLPQDSFLPVISVRDEFLAIDPVTQRILWRQPQPQASVVQWGDLPVPVLVTISVMRHRNNQNRRWLQIQAYDPETGQRLGDGGELPIDAITAADYDGITGVIRLLGRRTTYQLQLRSTLLGRDELPGL